VAVNPRGIGIETLGRLALGTLDLGLFHRRRDRPDNALSHLVLQIEDVADPTINPVGPKMCPCGGIDELTRDAHSVCRFANARVARTTGCAHVRLFQIETSPHR